jgi:RimJ/RimL family protein N-acetyltransferase
MSVKLNYRHLNLTDSKKISSYLTDPRVSKYLTWKAYSSQADIEEYVKKSVKKLNYPDEVLAIEAKNEILGTVHFILRPGGIVQFGFGIKPNYWGKGLGRKIVADMLKILSTAEWKKHCKVIRADVHKDNIWPQKVLLLNDFKLADKNVGNDRYRFLHNL